MPADPISADIVFHPSWPTSAQALLRQAIDRHGGWSLWTRLEAVSMTLRSLRGYLPWLKGHGRSFHLAGSLITYPKQGRTEWSDDAESPCLANFDRGSMRLVDPCTGRVQVESLDHRLTFRGLRKTRRWDALDAHYFFGYAFASYTAVPFILPSLPFRGATSGNLRGERLRGVRVVFPVGAQVHSRLQSYFFDASGLLRRNDYVADVVGAWAVGAHFWNEYITVEGLPLPAHRAVFPRLGKTPLPFPTVLSAFFGGFSVYFGGGDGESRGGPRTATRPRP